MNIGSAHFNCALSHIGNSTHNLIERGYYLYSACKHDDYNSIVMYDEISAKKVWIADEDASLRFIKPLYCTFYCTDIML